MAKVPYRFEVSSLEGLIKQLAQSLLPNGYRFYVLGRVPEGKNPEEVDLKLISRHGLAVSKFTRSRRKRTGAASLQYLRLGRLFLLIATGGEHEFFAAERGNIRDATRDPIKVGGYSVALRAGRPSVRIEVETFSLIKAHFVGAALSRSVEGLEGAVRALPFEPYGPVRRQLLGLVRAVNRRRRLAGLPPISLGAVRWRRRVVRAFERDDDPVAA